MLRNSPAAARSRPWFGSWLRPERMTEFIFAAFAAVFAFPLFGAEVAKKIFDLPADAAERALRSFAAQSGVEVLFVTDVTENIQTNAVKGEFTPRVAIDRMLVGTILVATENQRTGAFKIQRAHNPNARRAARDPGDNRVKKKMSSKNLQEL